MIKYFITAALLLFPVTFSGQDIGQLYIEEIAESEQIQYVVRDPGKAVLIVHSTVRELSFESNGEIYEVERPYIGVYRLWLRPGTHIITFKSETHLPRKKRFYIPEKDYIEVLVTSDLLPEQPNKNSSTQPVLIYGALRVNTIPRQVQMNLTSLGMYKGNTISERTPYYTDQILPGAYSIELEDKMYRSWCDTIDIVNGKLTDLNIPLRRYEQQYREEIQVLEPILKHRESKFHEVPIILSLLGTSGITYGYLTAQPQVIAAGVCSIILGVGVNLYFTGKSSSVYPDYSIGMLRNRWDELQKRIAFNQAYNDSLPPPTIKITDLE